MKYLDLKLFEENQCRDASSMQDIELDLLIGLNCPSALRPREIAFDEESARMQFANS